MAAIAGGLKGCSWVVRGTGNILVGAVVGFILRMAIVVG